MNTPIPTTALRRLRTTLDFRARAGLLVAATLACASLGAVAQTTAPLTRADVQADLARARAAGDIERGISASLGLSWMDERAQLRVASQPAPATAPAAAAPRGATRQEVTAEARRAR